MADKPVDYYKILEVSPQATQDQIRTAYKKAALKSHPDRVPSDSPERLARTKKFQQINDAYYTLSDTVRRRDYDAARQFHTFTDDEDDEDIDGEIPKTKPGGGFPWSAFGFGGGGAGAGTTKGGQQQQTKESFSNAQFGSVFEEMMRDNGMADDEDLGGNDGKRAVPNRRFWAVLGGISGAGIGAIIGNVVGAAAGAAAGYKLGAIRDVKGKPVYQVFQELDQSDKARLLSELAAKVFAQAVSG